MSENDTRTPPQIVAVADQPASALIAFVGQELEHWGFDVIDSTSRGLLVKAEGVELMIGIQAVRT